MSDDSLTAVEQVAARVLAASAGRPDRMSTSEQEARWALQDAHALLNLTRGLPENTWRGHPIYWDGHAWRYRDTDGRVDMEEKKACGRCGRAYGVNEHDPCLPHLPGVRNACCGHGEPRRAYIQFEDGRCVRGFNVIEEVDHE